MRRGLFAGLFLALAGAAHAQPYARARTAIVPLDDSAMERVIAWIDVRTVTWLNSALYQNRRDLVEGGACLHVGKSMGDGVVLDSAFAADSVRGANWHQVAFVCPASAVPIHWHIVTPALGGWLRAQGDSTGYVVNARCTPSDLDTAPGWSRYPLAALQCGTGADSIIVYRVKAR